MCSASIAPWQKMATTDVKGGKTTRAKAKITVKNARNGDESSNTFQTISKRLLQMHNFDREIEILLSATILPGIRKYSATSFWEA